MRDIKYIVIHETDNFKAGADAKAHNDFLLSQANTQELSWHYTVDDHEIYHNLPDDEAAYHASDHLKQDGGNLNGIGIDASTGNFYYRQEARMIIDRLNGMVNDYRARLRRKANEQAKKVAKKKTK